MGIIGFDRRSGSNGSGDDIVVVGGSGPGGTGEVDREAVSAKSCVGRMFALRSISIASGCPLAAPCAASLSASLFQNGSAESSFDSWAFVQVRVRWIVDGRDEYS